MTIDGRDLLVHRLMFALWRGGTTPGLVLDHLCRVRHCCNPDHLRECTQRENVTAPGSRTGAHNRERTHCDLGHALESVGTRRRCNVCARNRAREWRNNNRARFHEIQARSRRRRAGRNE